MRKIETYKVSLGVIYIITVWRSCPYLEGECTLVGTRWRSTTLPFSLLLFLEFLPKMLCMEISELLMLCLTNPRTAATEKVSANVSQTFVNSVSFMCHISIRSKVCNRFLVFLFSVHIFFTFAMQAYTCDTRIKKPLDLWHGLFYWQSENQKWR